MATNTHIESLGLEQTWRWFGPSDPVPLTHIKMSGATGVVSALHHIANGEVWSLEDIGKHKQLIETAGLSWSVVESVPIHEDIKQRSGHYQRYIANYQQTIKNLGQSGIDTICYNFMPVLDWTRTDLDFQMPDGAKALRFDIHQLIVFDVFVLKRKNAEFDYSSIQLQTAESIYKTMSAAQKQQLISNIIAGLPGAEEGYSLTDFQKTLNLYAQIDDQQLRFNLTEFIKQVIPTAVSANVMMAIHPDDPPFPILGLPRVVSTMDDIQTIIQACDVPNNGICFCAGSLAASDNNDVLAILKKYAHRINFVHLRNIAREQKGIFHESAHLDGKIDMYQVLRALLCEQSRRLQSGRLDYRMPMRPDHGHQMLDDLGKTVNPGYSAIGRLRGLAELRGLMLGIIRQLHYGLVGNYCSGATARLKVIRLKATLV